MSTWDDLKGSLFAAGRDVSQKAKEVSEIAKLKMDIHAKEDFVEKQYAILGKAYYEGAFEDPLPQLLPLFEKITLLKNPPEPVEEKCPNCGKIVNGANFCGNCGTKLK